MRAKTALWQHFNGFLQPGYIAQGIVETELSGVHQSTGVVDTRPDDLDLAELQGDVQCFHPVRREPDRPDLAFLLTLDKLVECSRSSHEIVAAADGVEETDIDVISTQLTQRLLQVAPSLFRGRANKFCRQDNLVSRDFSKGFSQLQVGIIRDRRIPVRNASRNKRISTTQRAGFRPSSTAGSARDDQPYPCRSRDGKR